MELELVFQLVAICGSPVPDVDGKDSVVEHSTRHAYDGDLGVVHLLNILQIVLHHKCHRLVLLGGVLH